MKELLRQKLNFVASKVASNTDMLTSIISLAFSVLLVIFYVFNMTDILNEVLRPFAPVWIKTAIFVVVVVIGHQISFYSHKDTSNNKDENNE